jgi:uncharacterized protein (TIGR02246 family)
MNQKTQDPELKTLSAQLVSSFDTAWNTRNPEALADLFQEGADFQFYYGLMLRGRKRIKKFYTEKVFPNLPEGWRHITRSFKARFLTDSVAIGDGKVDLVDENEADENKRLQRRIKVTSVVVKEGGRWLFAAVRLMVPTEE